MKGLEIEIGRRKFMVAVDDGFVSVLLNQMSDECHISVVGRDLKNGAKLVWLDEKLPEGEKVKVVFDDKQEKPAVPVKVVKMEGESLQVKLQKYNWAKNCLKEEGII